MFYADDGLCKTIIYCVAIYLSKKLNQIGCVLCAQVVQDNHLLCRGRFGENIVGAQTAILSSTAADAENFLLKYISSICVFCFMYLCF